MYFNGNRESKEFCTPLNCAECMYTGICTAPHYGGNGCNYEDTIKMRTIEEILKEVQK